MTHVSVQVFALLDDQLEQVRAAMSTQAIDRSSRTVKPSKQHVADDAMANFNSTYNAKPADNGRLERISSNIKPFVGNSQPLMPTSWVKTAPTVEGMQRIDLDDAATMRKVKKLCKRQTLKPPSGFVRSHSFHYGKYESNKLISLLSICVANLNGMPGSVAISVDIAASDKSDRTHSMSVAINSLSKILRKRRNKCVIFAQVAKTASAVRFWQGKLTKTKRASVMTALFSEFDNRYLIYEDTDDMALFFD